MRDKELNDIQGGEAKSKVPENVQIRHPEGIVAGSRRSSKAKSK
jgi:hypothetical protein